ncbi:MAG: hypothetical protein OXG56_04035, partial [Gammaproteobacteria bacterium]|nr:hypothetical protein [Gammaproteobacteria bacterium]
MPIEMAKHFRVTITEDGFSWNRDQAGIDQEAALDGIYVIRTESIRLWWRMSGYAAAGWCSASCCPWGRSTTA